MELCTHTWIDGRRAGHPAVPFFSAKGGTHSGSRAEVQPALPAVSLRKPSRERGRSGWERELPDWSHAFAQTFTSIPFSALSACRGES